MRNLFWTPALIAALAWSQPPIPSPAVVKILDLFGHLQTAQRVHAPVSFTLTEAELNDYARYALQAAPRPGMRSVKLKLFPGNYLSTYTVLDFDAIEKWKPGTIPTLLKPVLSGERRIWLDFRFHTAGGAAAFTVEKAYFQDIRLPAIFAGQLIHTVAAHQPEHFDTDKPLPLPFGLQQISTADGVVTGRN